MRVIQVSGTAAVLIGLRDTQQIRNEKIHCLSCYARAIRNVHVSSVHRKTWKRFGVPLLLCSSSHGRIPFPNIIILSYMACLRTTVNILLSETASIQFPAQELESVIITQICFRTGFFFHFHFCTESSKHWDVLVHMLFNEAPILASRYLQKESLIYSRKDRAYAT